MAKGKVTFDVERCKSCGLCVEACPKGILSNRYRGYIMQKVIIQLKIVDEEKCVGCASCALNVSRRCYYSRKRLIIF